MLDEKALMQNKELIPNLNEWENMEGKQQGEHAKHGTVGKLMKAHAQAMAVQQC